ncbi:MAG TPA: hypothetical protein VE377_05710 [Candidatus Dormibacteraeota bacterium]|nr:hypothetical protein [Candidatus Dormibacteraeota bacterium]
MSRFLSVVFAVVLLSALCVGQSSGRVDVFGGFSFVYPDMSFSDSTGMIGWNASATFPVKPSVGIVADFAGYYPGSGCSVCGPHSKVYTFLGGPQVSVTRGRLKPFARFLLGDTYDTSSIGGLPGFKVFTSSNAFTFGAGGGVDVGITPRLAFRGQVDWLHNLFKTQDNQLTHEEKHNVARISTGIVFRF